MNEIKPRWIDGRPWCSNECPQARDPGPQTLMCNKANLSFWHSEGPNYTDYNHIDLCPYAVERMAVELEAWKTMQIYTDDVNSYVVTVGNVGRYEDYEDAVDALMEKE